MMPTSVRLLTVLALPVLLALPACRSALPNREPLGEVFPSVTGEALSGETVSLPDDLAGAPAVLLVGYVQDAQFDADRWLFGLLQAGTPVALREVPTIPGLMASAAGGFIDEGMRSGIPHEDWRAVVTLYGGDARTLAEFTGNTRPRNMRVLLLDAEGRVVWFHDRGFSAGKLLELDRAARALLTVGDRSDVTPES